MSTIEERYDERFASSYQPDGHEVIAFAKSEVALVIHEHHESDCKALVTELYRLRAENERLTKSLDKARDQIVGRPAI